VPLNNKRTKRLIEFDDSSSSKRLTKNVVVSPPQVQQPEIKTTGKKVSINLLDSLKAKTTFTIDFSDAC
jgi:hypothetical protein